MKLFAAENLVSTAMAECEPWTFQPTEKLSLQIRGDKEARQEWYQTVSTKHNFYTGLVGCVPNQRVSKENPPRLLKAFAADYDIKLPVARIAEAIKEMPFKPTYIEQSLGGNFRLVWLLERPLVVESRDFCTFLLQRAHDLLRLGSLPGLDRKAFEETSRLYCNGCAWEATGAPPITSSAIQAFFVEAGKAFRFQAGDDETIPLDLVEKALRAKYPGFDWPAEFSLESQGPTFWIADSVSPQSAIVKAGGIFTFAAHADKPFYSWSDLLGKEFTAKFQSESIAKATEDIWYDSQNFWKRKEGVYVPLKEKEIGSYLKVTCRLSSKPGQSGVSPMDNALEHIYNHQWVTGAAPFAFQRSGLVIVNGKRRLNTYNRKPIEPAVGAQVWGPTGTFPFLSLHFDSLFSPKDQLKYFLAWWKHFYKSAVDWSPHPGQCLFLLGGAGCGKTLTNRELIGYSVGGYADASAYLINGSQFNSEVLDEPLWSIDDDSPANSPQAHAKAQAMFKKVAANQQHMRNAKFEKACMVEWMGRLVCTLNLDFVSSRLVGPLDNSSLDKTSLFRCFKEPQIAFPARTELIKIIRSEIPNLLRWLLDWEVPAEVKRDVRYGYQSFQEHTLMDRNQQASHSASFKELMIEYLMNWFVSNPEEKFWEGTVTTLLRSITNTDCNETILKSVRLEQVSRFLEQIQREGSFKIEDRKGPHNVRLWRFHRDDTAN